MICQVSDLVASNSLPKQLASSASVAAPHPPLPRSVCMCFSISELVQSSVWAGCVADVVLTLLNHSKLQPGQTIFWFVILNMEQQRTPDLTLVNMAKQGYDSSQL